ncbi:MAG TPA: c-type cytochrome domain-containing protein, partial [Planctomycetota bacterium]|nr:c-type cytochrome domain-containing protein [Planctomycetota bacterium]
MKPLRCSALALLLAVGALPAADNEGVTFFEKNIRPLFAEHCLKCHDATQNKSKGGLTLDTRVGWEKGGDTGPAIVPGKPDESLLFKALTYTHDDVKMPPKKKEGQLPDNKIAV